ncbi:MULTISPECIES: restriction endonuclease subunit S [Salinivibrio]|uniref:restriction endonuclease subunit S n=1 Tax=Salinivibrio TaxID=51366 RepID=UPI0009869C56|nr:MULTISPECIES: restriction endonuclease subunit S [Salinivibrio]OOF13673.1 ATPase [Salinivibrio sp. PR919]OOF17829.1 ATPase [Salinivibrio sp. PR932]OOF31151.1 ATPase [Salinivibrio proteolyticus]
MDPLQHIADDAPEHEPDTLPSLDEQKAIVAKLKALEEKGELTDEILAQYFAVKQKDTSDEEE